MHRIKQLVLLLTIAILSGCSSHNDIFNLNSTPSSLSKYYLWIKSLDKPSLNDEISYQQLRLTQSSETAKQQAKLYMILLHSLPSARIHNPYTAKSTLNDKAFSQYINQHLSMHDLALLTLLKDQLNQQLLQLRDIDKLKQTSEQQHAQMQLKLTMQQRAIESLEDKLEQLKTIEAAISKREQNQ